MTRRRIPRALMVKTIMRAIDKKLMERKAA